MTAELPTIHTVLVPADDPTAIGEFLRHLINVNEGPHVTVIAVIPHGDRFDDVVRVAQRYAADGDGYGLTIMPAQRDRWDAIHAALGYFEGDWLHLVDVDARPERGWAQLVERATEPEHLAVGDQHVAPVVGVVSVVLPVSEHAATRAQRLALTEADVVRGAASYAADRAARLGGVVRVADRADDLWVAIRAESLHDVGPLFRPSFRSWGYSDLVVRHDRAGYRAVVAEGWYVGRARAVGGGAEVAGDDAGRVAYLAAHLQSTVLAEHRVVASVRVRCATLHDLDLLRLVVNRAAPLIDAWSVTLGTNPLDVQDDPEFGERVKHGRLTAGDVALLRACDAATEAQVADAFGRWIEAVARTSRSGGSATARCEVWTDAPDEYGEALVRARIARELGATWVLDLAADEAIENEIKPDTIARWMRHPDPAVVSFDVAVQTLWHASHVMREDAPWGDNGTNRGGPHAARLWRVTSRLPVPVADRTAPPATPDGERVAALRVRRWRFMRAADRALRLPDAHDEGLRVSSVPRASRLGLHVLAYEREHPDDLARWLDESYGLADLAVIVWTGDWRDADKPTGWRDPSVPWFGDALVEAESPPPASGPSGDLRALAAAYGAAWVHRPLADDLAGARNAGIDALAAHGLAWSWFVDPDEWWADPHADARAVRRMVESSRAGWLVQTANYRTNGAPTISDSIRFARLDALDGRPLRMDGRVHESFGDAIAAVQAAGRHPRIAYAPFVQQHRGMALNPERMAEKLAKYERMLRAEVTDRPTNAGAWVSLAWHYLNDGHEAVADECLLRAVACAGSAYLPFREAGYLHLRRARAMFEQCLDRLVTGHQYHREAVAVVDWLRAHAPPAPVIDVGQSHATTPAPLPPFWGYDDRGGGA